MTARAGDAEARAPLRLPAGESETPERVEGPAETEEEGTPEPEAKPRLVVVGIVASAGGLDALGELMPRLPRGDMAFIVVQHLAPDHESMLPRLIARTTELDVVAAADGMPLQPGHVYVITPNVDLAVMHGVIRLVSPSPAPQRLPIDYLFRSLADDLGPSAIGVVLSGSGTDGTFGLEAIRAAGGLTFAQDPATARYDSMPRSALASGAADAALSPAAIGDELARLARQPFARARPVAAPVPQAQDELGRLFVLIRSEFGNDLTNYMLTTIERRIERRMTLHRIGRLADYVRLVQQDPGELRALYDDLLITVTSFFRDPEAFEALKRAVFPKLFENRGAQSAPVRVWVPACASGEEAYSIAISMVEFCEEHGIASRIQIFGTDVDPDEDKLVALDLDVVPLPDPDSKARCLLVSFRAKPPPREVPVVSGEHGEPDKAAAALTQRIRELERELAMTKEYLQTTLEDKDSTLEELKSANEELQSANEELQSTNEELQSTNEELETSKEEMQSTNEELTTVNDELQNRMVELGQINDDLHNVLAGVDNAVVIVGMDLRIRRYTSAAEKLFRLLPYDIGRPIGFVDPFLSGSGVEAKVSAVIQSLSAVEEEVLAANHRWYTLKITPYKTLEHSIRGALVTLVDIDVRKRALDMTRDVGSYADRFLAPIGHPLLIVDHRQRVVWCNDPFLSTFLLTRDEVVGNLLEALGGRRFEDPGLRQRVEQVFTSSSMFRGCTLQGRSNGARAVVVAGSRVPAAGEAALALLSFEPASDAPPGSPA